MSDVEIQVAHFFGGGEFGGKECENNLPPFLVVLNLKIKINIRYSSFFGFVSIVRMLCSNL